MFWCFRDIGQHLSLWLLNATINHPFQRDGRWKKRGKMVSTKGIFGVFFVPGCIGICILLLWFLCFLFLGWLLLCFVVVLLVSHSLILLVFWCYCNFCTGLAVVLVEHLLVGHHSLSFCWCFGVIVIFVLVWCWC